eukprot:2935005-Amphidinium_carterae.1
MANGRCNTMLVGQDCSRCAAKRLADVSHATVCALCCSTACCAFESNHQKLLPRARSRSWIRSDHEHCCLISFRLVAPWLGYVVLWQHPCSSRFCGPWSVIDVEGGITGRLGPKLADVYCDACAPALIHILWVDWLNFLKGQPRRHVVSQLKNGTRSFYNLSAVGGVFTAVLVLIFVNARNDCNNVMSPTGSTSVTVTNEKLKHKYWPSVVPDTSGVSLMGVQWSIDQETEENCLAWRDQETCDYARQAASQVTIEYCTLFADSVANAR